ncbi:MAG: DUF2812 domain-containing protein [Thermotaleaceae bacterium]
MARKGYRLVKAGKISYDFEECLPDEYQYRIEFIADKSFKSGKEYRTFLEGIGYKVFYKNINLNYSIGKVRWRPYGSGAGQISTNPGSYNKEILIIEKENDGRPFELHTSNADIAKYFKPIRNAWISLSAMFVAFSLWCFIQNEAPSNEIILFGIFGVIMIIPVIFYQKQINHYMKEAKIEE